MKKTAIIGFIIIAAIGVGLWYSSLGGLEKIEFSLDNRTEFTILGEKYEGYYNAQEVKQIFFKARDVAEETHLSLAVINYGDDAEAKNIKQFIGVESTDSIIQSSYHYERTVFKAPAFIKTEMDIHNSVMPKPEEVRNQATQFADSLGYKIQPVSLEIYKSESSLTVLFPLE